MKGKANTAYFKDCKQNQSEQRQEELHLMHVAIEMSKMLSVTYKRKIGGLDEMSLAITAHDLPESRSSLYGNNFKRVLVQGFVLKHKGKIN